MGGARGKRWRMQLAFEKLQTIPTSLRHDILVHRLTHKGMNHFHALSFSKQACHLHLLSPKSASFKTVNWSKWARKNLTALLTRLVANTLRGFRMLAANFEFPPCSFVILRTIISSLNILVVKMLLTANFAC